MADKKVSIEIQTTGAEKSAADFKKVSTAARDTAVQGVYPLGTSLRDTGKIGEDAAEGIGKTGVSMKNTGMLASQLGFQITDFTTQVSMGTSALTAFAQQAPQAIGALSMAGVATGPIGLGLTAAAVAIPILIAGFRALSNLMGPVGEGAKLIEDAGKNVADALTEDAVQRWEDVADAMKLQRDMVEATKGKFPELQKASAEAAASILKNEGTLYEASKVILQQLGFRLDKYNEIEQAEARAAANRKLEKDQALKEEQERLAKLREEAEKEQGIRDDMAARRQDIEEDRARAERDVGVLRISRDRWRNASVDAAPTAGRREEVRNEFDKDFGSSEMGVKLQAAEQTLAKAAADKKELEQKMMEQDNVLLAKQTEINDVAKAVEAKTREIEQNFQTQEVKAQADKITQVSEQMAKDLTDVLGKVTAKDDQSKAEVERLKELASDGQIVASELPEVANRFSQLMIDIREGNATLDGNVSELVTLQKQFLSNQFALRREIDAMKAASATAWANQAKINEDLR